MYDDLKYLKINLPEDILKMKCNGDFDKTLKLIDLRLEKEIPTSLRKRLELEKNIINIIKDEYIYSFDEALKIMQDNIKNFKEEELVELQDDSAADWILIDGEVKFNDSFYSNVIKTIPKLKERVVEQRDEEKNRKESQLIKDNMQSMKENGSAEYFIHMKASISIKDEFVRPGEKIKVHIPVPVNCQQLKNIKIINTSHVPKHVSSPDYPQRTVFFEEEMKQGMEFSVEYSYENHMNYVSPEPRNISEKQFDFCLEEVEPHIMFTPYIKELTKEIIGEETNPLLKARSIYDYITSNVKYSFMRKYFTITNIPEYAALNMKGDCGVQAILFITMLRCAGIPARWQSGLFVMPHNAGCHDWAQFYIEPYGWLYADPSFGGEGYRNNNLEKWNFYFGNLDPYRMISCSEFQHEFEPPKKHLRFDPYDNQVGECEYEDRGLLRENYKVSLEVLDMHEIKK